VNSNHTGIFLGGFSFSVCTSIVLLLSVARALLDASVCFRVPLFLLQRLKPQRDLDLQLSILVLSSTRVLLELRVSVDSCLRVRLLWSPRILSRRSSITGTNSQYLRRELYQKKIWHQLTYLRRKRFFNLKEFHESSNVARFHDS
jgi:hypothetical protein